jgi:hypothetical protein
MKFGDDAKALQELRGEHEVATAYLVTYRSLTDELVAKVKELEWYLTNTVELMCPKCTKQMMNVIMTSGALKLVPEAKAR